MNFLIRIHYLLQSIRTHWINHSHQRIIWCDWLNPEKHWPQVASKIIAVKQVFLSILIIRGMFINPLIERILQFIQIPHIFRSSEFNDAVSQCRILNTFCCPKQSSILYIIQNSMIKSKTIKFIVLAFFLAKCLLILTIHIKNNKLDIFPWILSDIFLYDRYNSTGFSASGITIHSEMLSEENIWIVANWNSAIINIGSYRCFPVFLLWSEDAA